MAEYYIAGAAGLVTAWFWSKSRPSNFPPGPVALPLFNNLLSVSMDEHLAGKLQQLHTQYGPMVSLAIAANNIWDVWINDFDIIKEVLLDNRFNSRKVFGFFKIFEVGAEQGLAFDSGESWKAKRRLMSQIFRNMGVGRNSYGGMVESEVEKFIKHIGNQEDKNDICLRQMIGYMANNVIFKLLFNKSFDYTDPKYLEIFHYLTRTFELQNPSGIHWVLPLCIARHLPISKELLSIRSQFEAVMMGYFQDRKPGSKDDVSKREPQCVSDYMWDKIILEEDQIMNEKTAHGIIMDMIIAGQETTTNALSWLVLSMIHYPDVQEKVYQELKSKVDLESPIVSLSVQNDCHYTMAVINETMRFHPLVYSTLDHTAEEDIENFHGYRIPKGTRMFANLVCVYRDEKHWKNAGSYYPENFLDDSEKFQRHPCMIPFSIGARSCIGEGAAKMEVFTAFASIVRKFKIEAVGEEKPTLTPVVGFIGVAPNNFNVRLSPRDA